MARMGHASTRKRRASGHDGALNDGPPFGREGFEQLGSVVQLQ
jgi:hypothetical protein